MDPKPSSNHQEQSYFDEFIKNPTNQVVFEQERLAEEISEFVLDALANLPTDAFIKKNLDEFSPLTKGSDMNLRTIVELVAAVGYKVNLTFEPIVPRTL